jgi:hypothetical protein
MVTAELERLFAERGVLLIPRDAGVRMLCDELAHREKGSAEIVVTGGSWIRDASANRRPAGAVSSEGST